MSMLTIMPGDLVTLDPSDKKVLRFDFDARNLPAGVSLTNSAPAFGLTIEAIQQNGSTPLTMDEIGLVTGNRKVQARFLATTASVGDRYRISCKGTTDETPSQEKEYSITVLIENR